MKKRKLRWQIKLILFLILLVVYSFTLGTKGIFVKEYKLETNKINSKLDGIKIIQFSDLLYGSSTKKKTVSSLIKKINITKPDIVIFTGGLIKNRYNLTDKEEDFLIKELSNINSELGKYYVLDKNIDTTYEDILIKSGFISLHNEEQIFYKSINNPIAIISNTNCKKFFSNNKDFNGFKILAINNPNKYDNYKKYNFDAVFSGHTLNGQIYIPKLNNYIINSKYYKPYQKINNTKLFINNGIGTKYLPARLFNHPTINLYRLYKK